MKGTKGDDTMNMNSDGDLERIADVLESSLRDIRETLVYQYDRQDEIASFLERIANALEKISEREQQ